MTGLKRISVVDDSFENLKYNRADARLVCHCHVILIWPGPR